MDKKTIYNLTTPPEIYGRTTINSVDEDFLLTFASNAFTAPVTGSYFLTASVSIHDHTSSNTTGRMHISTSNRGYIYEFDPAENISGAGVGSFAITVLADMDAGDTASVLLNIFDAGSKLVDIQASGTFFQGHLVG